VPRVLARFDRDVCALAAYEGRVWVGFSESWQCGLDRCDRSTIVRVSASNGARKEIVRSSRGAVQGLAVNAHGIEIVEETYDDNRGFGTVYERVAEDGGAVPNDEAEPAPYTIWQDRVCWGPSGSDGCSSLAAMAPGLEFGYEDIVASDRDNIYAWACPTGPCRPPGVDDVHPRKG
jgi:hypothetical protein